jgi:type VI secretion system protein
MAHERSLLERFRDPEPDLGSRTLRLNTKHLADSVLRNLRHVLNARHGVAMTRADYGIPDLCDIIHSFPDAVAGLRKAIKETVEKFEPRLRRVYVKHVESPDDPQALHYEITADLVTEEEKTSVHFETRIAGSGQVGVKG